ncbi:hypothetical protein LPJ59_004725, partial [Coemansia sp. RSA 2399]
VCERRIRNSFFMVDFMEMPNPMYGHMLPQDRGQRRNLWPPARMNAANNFQGMDAANNFHGMGVPGLMAGPVVRPELVAEIFDTIDRHNLDSDFDSDDDFDNDDDDDDDPHDEPTVDAYDDIGHNDDMNRGEFLAHFMGNWRVVDNHAPDHRPPSPQPGPVPSSHMDPSSTSTSPHEETGFRNRQ